METRSFSGTDNDFQTDRLRRDLLQTLDRLPDLENGALIAQIMNTLVRMANQEAERLDWKILSYSLLDMEGGFQAFYPYRHTRKVTVFGSARTPISQPEYQMAVEFARRVTKQGFMVMTEPARLGGDGQGQAPGWEITEIALPQSVPSRPRNLFRRWSEGKDCPVHRAKPQNPKGKNGSTKIIPMKVVN